MPTQDSLYQNQDQTQWVSVSVAAREIGVCVETVRRRIYSGKLKAFKPNGMRQWIVRLPMESFNAE